MTSPDPTLLAHALSRAGILVTFTEADGSLVVILEQDAADDVAERVLRTVPLRGTPEAPAVATLHAASVVPDLRLAAAALPVPAPSPVPRPHVVQDTGLAVVPRGPVADALAAPDDRSGADCTCMVNVLKCALHAPRTLPTGPTLTTQGEPPASGDDDA